jgi:quercetin dioxygenase-like cupin family protein
MKVFSTFNTLAALALVAGSMTSGLAVAADSDAVFTTPGQVKYDVIIPGVADFGTVYGSREKGPHGTFVKIKKGQGTPGHTHSKGYHAVVLEGVVENPVPGNQANPTKLVAGSYYFVPANAEHITRCATSSPTDCKTFFYQDSGFDFIPSK